MPSGKSKNFAYFQPNRPAWKSWMIFDIDHENPFIFEDANLPPPNLIVSNRDNGKSHIFYAINPVFYGENANKKPYKFYKSVRDNYQRLLKADMDYNEHICKTPFNKRWRTSVLHDNVYSLGDLNEHIKNDPEKTSFKAKSKKQPTTPHSNSRHCLLFDKVRFQAYLDVHQFREIGQEAFHKNVLDLCQKLNAETSREINKIPLSHSQLKSTAKSISCWTWDNITTKKIRRGFMQLAGSDLSLRKKQELSAHYARSINTETKKAQFLNALRDIASLQQKPTISKIAKLAKLTWATTKKYMVEFLNSGDQATKSSLKPIHSGDNQIRTCYWEFGVAGMSGCNAVGLSDSLPPFSSVAPPASEVKFNQNRFFHVCVGNSGDPPPGLSQLNSEKHRAIERFSCRENIFAANDSII